jgi:hypothetical protein
MRNLLSATEQARNKRLKELFNEKKDRILNVSIPTPRTTLTQSEMEQVKELMKDGITRQEAVKQVLNK